MAAHSGSVIGVSRSGRVRKKSAKLMEMEDFDESETQQSNRRKPNALNASASSAGGNSGTIHISYLPQTPRDKGASYLNPKAKQTASAGNSAKKRDISPSTPKFSRKKLTATSTPAIPVPVTSKKRKINDSEELDSEKEDESLLCEAKEERVIAIKQMSPTYDTLSGSAYLMGEDLHYITGEPVISNDDASLSSDNDDNDTSRQLKVDVGYAEEPSVSVSEESGLKMKFILSPKSGVKAGKSDKNKSGKSSSSKKKKSSKSKKSSGKSKGKKSHSMQDVAALDLLASGGTIPSNGNSSAEDDLSDDINGDYMGSSKLIIAEPTRASNSKSKKKKKKKRESESSMDVGDTGKHSSGKKSKLSKESTVEEVTLDIAPTLPQSLYFKEKNSTKKKASKKSVAKPKEKGEKKQRPITAYMLWSQEYRKIVVSENPGFDFAQISRRLGEIWQSYPEKEKMQWRSKAKIKSGKMAIMNNSNLINTSRKPATELTEKTRPLGLKPIILPTKTEEISPLSPRDINKVVGTSPLDVAAHLKLLGESLGTIGQRLTQHEGQIAVSGSLSVLLDSILCSLGPLLCLTSEIDQLNGCSKEVHQKILDNIAYIMPGL